MAQKTNVQAKGKNSFVFSTASQDFAYTAFDARKGKKDKDGPNVPISRILIKGGANVANKKTLITPLSVCTEVTAEQLEALMADPHFLRHMERGFMVVKDTKVDPEVAATEDGVTAKDESAPLVEADFPKTVPTTAGTEGDTDKKD